MGRNGTIAEDGPVPGKPPNRTSQVLGLRMDDFGVNQDLDWIIEIRRPPMGN